MDDVTPVGPLLSLQELDLAADAAEARSRDLPERATLPKLEAALVEIERRLTEARDEQTKLQAEEERLGLQVSQIAKEIEASELERYSGKHLSRDDSNAHDASQRERREKKDALEAQELELLESLEEVESRIVAIDADKTTNRREAQNLSHLIRKVEEEVASELKNLADRRLGMAPEISEQILSAYDRVRKQPQSGGRGAAHISDGRCSACRIKLPSHEKAKMLAEPPDAVIQCPQCRRVLIR